ncbi:hypothetical protein DIRU0_B03378 [Diutina rugosa]
MFQRESKPNNVPTSIVSNPLRSIEPITFVSWTSQEIFASRDSDGSPRGWCANDILRKSPRNLILYCINLFIQGIHEQFLDLTKESTTFS